MRRMILLLPLVLFLLLAAFLYRGLYGQPEVLPSALIGKPLPAFELPAVQGGAPVNRQALLGKPALVNVWGTWCVACREEHPVLNALKAQGVLIHGIDYKDDNAAARRWLADFHDPYALNADDASGSLGLDLGVYGAPETYLIDAQGIIRYKHVGVITEQVWRDELASRYQALLEAGQ